MKRGIEVELWEKENVLGGMLNAAGAPSFKSDVKRYVDYSINKLYRSGAIVRLSHQATLPKIEKGNFDAVIFAAGANAFIPPIKGIESANVKTSTEILLNGMDGETCVVIGGGLVGCETFYERIKY